jgi:hypothetical protein
MHLMSRGVFAGERCVDREAVRPVVSTPTRRLKIEAPRADEVVGTSVRTSDPYDDPLDHLAEVASLVLELSRRGDIGGFTDGEEASAEIPPYAEEAAFFYEVASASEVARFEQAREQAERQLRSGPLSGWVIGALRNEIRLSGEYGVSPWLLAYSEAIHEHDPELWRIIANGKGNARRCAQRATRALAPIRPSSAPLSCQARHRGVGRRPRARGLRARRRTSASRRSTDDSGGEPPPALGGQLTSPLDRSSRAAKALGGAR